MIIGDRNYPSYWWLATRHQANRNYLIRCSAASFAKARRMLKGEDSQIVILKPHHSPLQQIKRIGLPQSITVRLVRVVLKTGEYEVFVTRLLEEQTHPTPLYALRWGEETFYGRVETRLN